MQTQSAPKIFAGLEAEPDMSFDFSGTLLGKHENPGYDPGFRPLDEVQPTTQTKSCVAHRPREAEMQSSFSVMTPSRAAYAPIPSEPSGENSNGSGLKLNGPKRTMVIAGWVAVAMVSLIFFFTGTSKGAVTDVSMMKSKETHSPTMQPGFVPQPPRVFDDDTHDRRPAPYNPVPPIKDAIPNHDPSASLLSHHHYHDHDPIPTPIQPPSPEGHPRVIQEGGQPSPVRRPVNQPAIGGKPDPNNPAPEFLRSSLPDAIEGLGHHGSHHDSDEPDQDEPQPNPVGDQPNPQPNPEPEPGQSDEPQPDPQPEPEPQPAPEPTQPLPYAAGEEEPWWVQFIPPAFRNQVPHKVVVDIPDKTIDRARDRAEDAADRLHDRAEDAAERVRDGIEDAADRIHDRVHDIREHEPTLPPSLREDGLPPWVNFVPPQYLPLLRLPTSVPTPVPEKQHHHHHHHHKKDETSHEHGVDDSTEQKPDPKHLREHPYQYFDDSVQDDQDDDAMLYDAREVEREERKRLQRELKKRLKDLRDDDRADDTVVEEDDSVDDAIDDKQREARKKEHQAERSAEKAKERAKEKEKEKEKAAKKEEEKQDEKDARKQAAKEAEKQHEKDKERQRQKEQEALEARKRAEEEQKEKDRQHEKEKQAAKDAEKAAEKKRQMDAEAEKERERQHQKEAEKEHQKAIDRDLEKEKQHQQAKEAEKEAEKAREREKEAQEARDRAKEKEKEKLKEADKHHH
jgi:hypothetical protein